jgi:Zn finger protein HypA/HybF involved in hydrogenase expression
VDHNKKTEVLYKAPAVPVQAQPVAQDELAQLLHDLRPKFGAIGSRDVDVAAQQKRVDAAIAALAATQPAVAPECDTCDGNGVLGSPPDQYHHCPECADQSARVPAQGEREAIDLLRDMLSIQDACNLHTDEYAPGSVIEYIKELEGDLAAARTAKVQPEAIPEDDRQFSELLAGVLDAAEADEIEGYRVARKALIDYANGYLAAAPAPAQQDKQAGEDDVRDAALICPQCKSDRSKDRCKAEHWQRCPMAGTAQQPDGAGGA